MDHRGVEWKPWSKKARKFVPLHDNCTQVYMDRKHSLKFTNSQTHSLKGYTDDVTLISTDVDVHTSVLQTIDRKTANLDLSFKPAKCISYLFDDSSGHFFIQGYNQIYCWRCNQVFWGRLLMCHWLLLKRLQVQKWKLASPVYCQLLTLQIRGEYKLRITSSPCNVLTPVWMLFQTLLSHN